MLPPVHHPQIGRPPKKRRKSVIEVEEMVKQGGKLSRVGKTVRCMLCKELGHNKRSCKGQKMGPKLAATNKKRKTSATNGTKTTTKAAAPHSPPARPSQGIVIRDSPSANTRSSRKQAADANKDPKHKGKEKVV